MVEGSADTAEFEALLAPILSKAYGYAVSLTGDRTDAEDLIQETALLAFRSFRTFSPGTSFKAWFYRILTNRNFERHRGARRRLPGGHRSLSPPPRA